MADSDKEDDDVGVHFTIPRGTFYSIAAGLVLGGGGLVGTAVSQLDRTQAQACLDNSERALEQASIALTVAGQHGQEFVNAAQERSRIEKLIYERTRERYTEGKALADQREQSKVDAAQDRDRGSMQRRIEWLEDRHSGK